MENWNSAALLRALFSAFPEARFYRPLSLFPATGKERTILATDRVLIPLELPLLPVIC